MAKSYTTRGTEKKFLNDAIAASKAKSTQKERLKHITTME